MSGGGTSAGGLAELLRGALAAAAEELAADGTSSLDGETVGELLAAAVVLSGARAAAGEPLAPFAPVPGLPAPTATDVCVVASAMLEAASVEVFELGLWRTWGTRGETSDRGPA